MFQRVPYMRKTMTILAAGASLLVSSAATVQAAVTASRTRCFYSSQFEQWKAADAKTIYIRVSPHRFYRLDLAAPCSRLRSPGAFLVTKLHGSTDICSAADWDMHVAVSWSDIPTACIVKAMTELSPQEAAAIPKNALP